ncbi:hypothetical protein [Marinicauda sp. Alg238-R41]|uniref:hypothetical protein n=1 Tax=Marinicauda sp. Alg238-R41 TaxID=2993447 RepID=UPI0022E125F6|nr:hypothetical protein [Marinicauda sp. Alg238-R41]
MTTRRGKPFRRPRRKFIIAPPHVLWDVIEGHLTHTDLIIANVLGTMTNNNGWISNQAQGTIAYLADVSRETVNRSMKRLVLRGHLRVIDPPSPGGRKSYQLIFDRRPEGSEAQTAYHLSLLEQIGADQGIPAELLAPLKQALSGTAKARGCDASVTGSGGVTPASQGGVIPDDHRGCDPSRHTRDEVLSGENNPDPSSPGGSPMRPDRTGPDGHNASGPHEAGRGPGLTLDAIKRIREQAKEEFGMEAYRADIASLQFIGDSVVTDRFKAETIAERYGAFLRRQGIRVIRDGGSYERAL